MEITRFMLICVSLCATLASAIPWVPNAPGQVENWMHRHELMLNQTLLHAGDAKVVFLGDSITYRWSQFGKPVWQEHYAPRHAYNYGIGGDRTENILWRIQHGEFEKYCFVSGTNNVSHKDNATDIAKGVSAVLDSLHTKMPKAKVLLLSVLPRATVRYDTEIHELNTLIHRFADNARVYWLDLAIFFETTLAHVLPELYEPDQIHLSLKGYQLWQKQMEPLFSQLIQ